MEGRHAGLPLHYGRWMASRLKRLKGLFSLAQGLEADHRLTGKPFAQWGQVGQIPSALAIAASICARTGSLAICGNGNNAC
jgi:hypothetical protein